MDFRADFRGVDRSHLLATFVIQSIRAPWVRIGLGYSDSRIEIPGSKTYAIC
jgi:hypothetical protein